MIRLDGSHLSIADVVSIARNFESVTLTENARKNMEKSQLLVMELLHSQKTVYGVNTGFGSLSSAKIIVFLSEKHI